MVLSGSMEPTYPTGCMLYLKQVEPEEIKVGDPITFELNEKTNGTHRVTRIDKENRCFYTKGDNNDNEDGKPVSFDSLKGKPIFHVPQLGYFADFISAGTGRYIAIAAGCVVFLLLFIPDLLFPSEEEKKAKEDSDALKKQKVLHLHLTHSSQWAIL
jgi:signal peptidase